MSNSKKEEPMMYERIQAVGALNQVPGFNPMKLLRRTFSPETKEPMLQLDLPYKKLWFRLANPKGKIRLHPLTITEQLAIFEAQVFLDRSDVEPIGNFTACCDKDHAPDGKYILAAQQEAVNEALSDAGYGIQFADVSMREADRRYGSRVPAGAAAEITADAEKSEVPVVKTAEIPEEREKAADTNGNRNVKLQEELGQQNAVTEKKESLAPEAAPVKETALQRNAQLQEEKELPVSGTNAEKPMEQPVLPAAASMRMEQQTAPPVVLNTPAREPEVQKYTEDMPVEQLLAQMTLEEAKAVVVDSGACKGWTLAEVAEKRPPSLKFYVYGYKGGSNILRAAAQLMLNDLAARKAG